MRRRLLLLVLAFGGALVLVAAQQAATDSTKSVRDGGIFRIAFHSSSGLDYVDPALASYAPGWAILDTTCAHLLTYPDKPAPASYHYVNEVAKTYKIRNDRKEDTFYRHSRLRFSDGTPDHADAFERAINRALLVESSGAQHTRDIVGAQDVLDGKSPKASGVKARRNTLVIRFTRPVPDFLHRTTTTYFCAVPPNLPADPEGVHAFPAAGPYYVADYRPGERVLLRRNRYYGGKRPHHVDGFDVDLSPLSPQDPLRLVDRGAADWAYVTAGIYFDKSLGLVA